MINITLPNGNILQFNTPPTGAEIASAIGEGLAKAALAIKINNQIIDLATHIEHSTTIEIITLKSTEALELIRHDCAHILAEAVQELYPNTQITFGPAIENGFYYDFHRDTPFSTEDFNAIEQRMKDIVDRNQPFKRHVWDRNKAIKYFNDKGETFKAQHIESLPKGEDITIYSQGEWTDLCRGPHLPSTGKIGKAFKLMKLAGAYWKGDPSAPQLQRMYGTCWRNEKELNQYLTRIEQAEKRDHRKLGKQLQLFHLQEEAIGSVFWHPKGWTLYRTIETYIRQKLQKANYLEIKTPQLIDRKLWEQSGHWDKFRNHMFITEVDEGLNPDDEDSNKKIKHSYMKRHMALKPMNCPCHVQVFKQGLKSYRELPLRLAEFGACHRYEPSGALHGLMRVRSFVQDDGHIFCTPEQIVEETKIFCDLLLTIYKDFGFNEVEIKFSDRPKIRAGSDEVWDQAENALEQAIKATKIPYEINPAEGAFYGPKLEFILKDAIGRNWQCGTWQVDFVLPERLNAEYIASDGSRQRPVMLHRAILGSFERFIGILIENYEGKFPLWLAPTQIVIASITSDAEKYAQKVLQKCENANLRAITDIRNEQISYKIREHSLEKTPIIFVVGEQEAKNNSVAIRRLGGKQQEILNLNDAIKTIQENAKPPNL